MKPRVLIPTNDTGFASDLAEAYSRAGYEAIVGKENFFLTTAEFDIVHLHWPEEFSDWVIPDDHTLTRIEKALDNWSSRSRVLLSVHNLYPHGYEGNRKFYDLYSMFFEKVHFLSYFSKASMLLVKEYYGEIADKPCLMHGLFNYERLRKSDSSRERTRKEFGLEESDFVILVLGLIRNWQEIQLIRDSFNRCQVPGKRLLMVSRYVESGNIWRQRIRRRQWHIWLKWKNAVIYNKYVPDEDIHKFLNATDVVLVPRINQISSGLLPLAMTFGKVIIAPDHGAFPEYLQGTENPLYESGNPDDLAKKLGLASKLDVQVIGKSNEKIAKDWTWDGIVAKSLCLIYGNNPIDSVSR